MTHFGETVYSLIAVMEDDSMITLPYTSEELAQQAAEEVEALYGESLSYWAIAVSQMNTRLLEPSTLH